MGKKKVITSYDVVKKEKKEEIMILKSKYTEDMGEILREKRWYGKDYVVIKSYKIIKGKEMI